MKKILKYLLILVLLVIGFGVGFILTLQIFEYRPKEVTVLDIQNNPSDNLTNYIQLDNDIKILTFNIGYASLGETEDFVMDGGKKGKMDSKEEVQKNVDGITSILARENADINLIQEVDVDSKRSYEINEYDAINNILGKSSVLAYNYRCIFVPFPFDLSQMMGKVNSGVATFSDYRSSDASRLQLPGSFSWPLKLANLKRCLLVTRYPIANSDKEFVLINAHLSAYDDGSMRELETAYLESVMDTEYKLGNYVMVGGDFNQTFPGAVTKDAETGVLDYLFELKNEAYWQAYPLDAKWFIDNNYQFGIDTSTPSCRLLNKPYDKENLENNQYYLIDGFIVSPNILINSITTLDENFVYSDHNPVVMSFKLPS